MSGSNNGNWLKTLFRRKDTDFPAAPDIPSLFSGPAFPAAFAPPSVVTPLSLDPAPTPEAPPITAADAAFACYRLKTPDGRTLALHDGEAHPAPHITLDAASPILLIVAASQPHVGLLLTADIRAFAIDGDPLRGSPTSARLMRSNRPDFLRLKQPLGGSRFLTCPPAQEGAPPHGHLRFDGSGNTMQAIWQIVPADVADMTLAARTLAVEFAAALNAGLRQEVLMDRLRAGALGPILAAPILRLIPREDLADLARRLLDDAALRTALQRVMPDNRFLTAAFPALAEWRITRGPLSADGQADSPAEDETELAACANASGASVGLTLLSYARTTTVPRRGIAILAAVRNEGPYLLEWIAYHLSIGIEHIFLYSNDNTDGSDPLLALLARHGVITHIRNAVGATLGAQDKAYAHAFTLLPQTLDYRWTAIIDIDEYIVFNAGQFAGIDDFIGLHEAQPVDAIALNWLMFGTPFGAAYEPGLTIQRVTSRLSAVDTHIKSLCRTRLFWGAQMHYPHPVQELPFVFRNQDGGFHHHPGVFDRTPAFSGKPSDSQAWINHYVFRTAEEALWKAARGDGGWARHVDAATREANLDRVCRIYLETACEKLVEDRRIIACARNAPRAMEKLLALPGIAAVQERIAQNFEKTLRTLRDEMLHKPLPDHASPARRRFLDALAQSQGVVHQTVYAATGPMV